jgi:hypothetical protein
VHPFFGRYCWDDGMPVPAELHMTCLGCRYDLTGVDRRICPKCGRRFSLPIPPELGLHCPKCDYELTGLISRVCPECGTPFDPRELLRASRTTSHYSLSDRIPWHDLLQGAAGALMAVIGVLLAVRSVPMLIFFCALGAVIFISRGVAQGMSGSIMAIWVGAFWLILGMLATVFTR